jgi:hypothetical protein
MAAECSLGHPQQEHETHHGSMSRTRWAIDGPDGTSLELEGRKFSSNDDGAPMLCNLVCTSMGRHVHIDYCRGDPCDNPEAQHINERMVPNPDQPKDWITHGLHWRRMGKTVTSARYLILILLIPRLGFKGDGDENSVLPASNECIFADPYPREEQANFAKWCVIS